MDSVYATGWETVAKTIALSLSVQSFVRIEAKPPCRSTASVLTSYLRHQNYDHHAGLKQSALPDEEHLWMQWTLHREVA